MNIVFIQLPVSVYFRVRNLTVFKFPKDFRMPEF